MGYESALKLLARIIAAAVSIFLAILGILRYEDGSYYSYFHIMGSIYILIAFVIMLSVISLPIMKRYFAFTANPIGLGVFMVFCGFLVYDWNRKSEFACAICLFSAGAINCIVGLVA